MHNILDEFEFQADRNIGYGVALDHSNKFPYSYNGGEGSHHVFSAVFDRIFFILAGNENMHKSLNEFEFRPDPTTDHRISCP